MKNTGKVAILLIYEPTPGKGQPIPLARLAGNTELLSVVAKTALSQAEARADHLSKSDSLLGEVEKVEVTRLRALLSILIPAKQSNFPTLKLVN